MQETPRAPARRDSPPWVAAAADPGGDDTPAGRARPFDVILAEQAAGAGLRKAERTRWRLMAATAALLQDRFVHALRVTDVAAGAGLSPGTFYLYFEDKRDAAAGTLDAFARYVHQRLEDAAAAETTLPASVRATTLAYVTEFEQNPGLFRALMQMTEESARFEAIYRRLNGRWNRRTAAAIGHWRTGASSPADEDVLRAYALGGMVDEFLANLYVRRDPALRARVRSREQAAEVLADIWLRAVTLA